MRNYCIFEGFLDWILIQALLSGEIVKINQYIIYKTIETVIKRPKPVVAQLP